MTPGNGVLKEEKGKSKKKNPKQTKRNHCCLLFQFLIFSASKNIASGNSLH